MLNFKGTFILLDIYNNVIGKRVVVVYIHQNALLTIDIDIDLSCYTHIDPLMQLKRRYSYLDDLGVVFAVGQNSHFQGIIKWKLLIELISFIYSFSSPVAQ